MKCARVIFSILLILLVCPVTSTAQNFESYHFTQDNGLPSNHVYGMLTDRLGYLWICTDKGVVKYNGYTFKYFDESDGLVNNDVWEMVEDRQGRIWLASFASKMGYILNDKYHKVELAAPRKSVFPEDMRAGLNGIVFKSSAYLKGGHELELCYSRRDTIFSKPLDWITEGNEGIDDRCTSHGAWRADGIEYSALLGNYIYSYDFSDSNKLFSLPLEPQRRAKIADVFDTRNYRFGNTLLSVGTNRNVSLTNLLSGTIKRTVLDLGYDKVVYHTHFKKGTAGDDKANIITERHVFICEIAHDTIYARSKFSINDLVGKGVEADKITTFHKADDWFFLGSLTQGAWQIKTTNFPFMKSEESERRGKLVGQYGGSMTFWFDRIDNIFSVYDGNSQPYRLHAPDLSAVSQVQHLNSDTFLIYARYPFYYLAAPRKLLLVTKGVSGLYAGIRRGKLTKSITQYGYYHIADMGGLLKCSVPDGNRYNGLICHRQIGTTVCYNKERIIAEDSNGKIEVVKNGDRLWGTDVGDVHLMATDSLFGNIFLVGRDKLYLLDLAQKKCAPIFTNVLFKDVTALTINRDLLCVVWSYGVLFAKILGQGKMSEPVMETSLLKYRQVNDAYISEGYLNLVAANRSYCVRPPYFSNVKERISSASKHRFIVQTDDSASVLRTGDTIVLRQDQAKILLDVINPNGIGKLKFFVRFGHDPEQLLNSNEAIIPRSVSPGRYIHFSVRVTDATWVSPSINAVIFVVPKWYQTSKGEVILFILLMVVGLSVVIAIILVTRRLVLRRNERKQAQTELELKSIYAQINPHFIFNTLNSALLLISKNRMDEAYIHVSKFSRLLRSYLRSSRNKYVSVTEEATNLKNYIELQQARFRDRFDYDVVIDQSIRNEKLSIPSLLIQPFVENAINHGLLPMQGGGRLVISFSYNAAGNIVECIIDDNGIGREQSKQDKIGREEVRDSYGDLIISDLVRAFNKYEKMNVHISYYDKLLPDAGTIVTIAVKNPRHEL